MSGSFENLNKQIASFIILSTALATPVAVSPVEATDNLIADAGIMKSPLPIGTVEMYAAPQIPVNYTGPDPYVVQPPAVRYAAPQIPVNYTGPDPFVVQPPAVRYAAPQIQNIIPLKENLSPDVNSDINSSSLNLQNSNLPSDVKNKAINVGENINNTNTNINININKEGFIYSDYGNMKVIKPYSHIIFK